MAPTKKGTKSLPKVEQLTPYMVLHNQPPPDRAGKGATRLKVIEALKSLKPKSAVYIPKKDLTTLNRIAKAEYPNYTIQSIRDTTNPTFYWVHRIA